MSILQQLDAPPVPISELVLVDQHEAQGWRVRQDERLDHLFEERCDWVRTYGRPGQLAVDAGEQSLTYEELDARANRLARYLRLHGASAGDRIALLLDVPTDSYVAMLAVLKIGAAYVPLDVGFAADRMAHIVADARVRTVLTTSPVADRLERIDLLTAAGAELVRLDQAARLIDEQSPRRLIDAERGVRDDQLAYIIYPARSDAPPHGVAIDHRSICNFVKVAAEVYGIRPRDRVYQALSLAFDFSVEEIWVPWARGATLVPRPAGATLQGRELHEFLISRRVSAMCCVPGLLATLPGDLPGLRFLLVAGEACPPELVERWHRPGRRFLGVYGPAEATVTAAWTELHPGKPPGVGVPLPTYSTVILDVDDPYRALPHGEIGEIGIAGIGLSCGYLNRADLTDRAFIPDFLGIPANPSGRIYRTGDLGRVNAGGEIEHHGRIDLADPMRGYRVELAEIESLLLRVPEIARALTEAPAPAAYADPTTGTEQALAEVLAAVLKVEQVSVESHFFADLGADSMVMAQFCARVRKRADLPSVSMKDVYRNLTIRGLATALAEPAPVLLEHSLAEVLADVLKAEQVPVEGHFFDDLGADSMVMAQFCARVRKRADLPSVSMKDVYRAPTIRGLASALGEPAPAAVAVPEPAPAPAAPPLELGEPTGTPRYVLCGTLQLLALVGYAYLGLLVAVRGIEWIVTGSDVLDTYLRAVLFVGASFLGLSLLSVVAKWLLVGRWTPRRVRVWSLAYFRFWLVRMLVRTNPLVLFAGSPLYVLYLRALGAKIGRGAVVLSPHVPVCTDLLTIGEGTVVRKDAHLPGYRAHDGAIETGPVGLGRDVLVGEATVLDIGTSIGDGGQLGHSSSLHTGQAVPAGERWHGSPAVRTDVDYRTVAPARCGTTRRIAYPALQLLNVLLLVPLVLGSATLLLAQVPQVTALLGPGPHAFTGPRFYLQALATSYWLFLGSLLVGLLVVVVVPRLLRRLVPPDTVVPLYGIRYWAFRVITRMTNVASFTELFGDSSYIVGYLRCLGYRLSPVEQTGSNFGMAVKHDTPYLSGVGSGTVVADGLSFVNADFSSTSFRVSRVAIGRNNFLGNNIAYPAQGRTGDNCLLATKVMVPIDGEVREGVGLLGSPCFEIPRSVERDTSLEVASPAELRRRLADKNAHNVATIALRLLVRWVHTFGLTLLAMVGVDLYHAWGAAELVLSAALVPLLSVGYFVLVERAVAGLKTLAPQGCSIYDRAFWRHERHWKVPFTKYVQAFNGTPFKTVIWRLLGVRIGRRVFDDGCTVIEKTFVTIGDGCTLNAGSVIQPHSQEDGAFKSDLVTIGAGCTLGIGAFVHYGVTIGDGAQLAPDSFLMKGEEIPPGERWGGNPARETGN
ncbi:MAG TPA: Pls/PosA family non-ribosomal peptide synthetase [Pseudonocardia sp.]|nr:Pls/PosA family non-ribosomal peptide synthetase [Pseudonocardia sp.]